MDDLRGLWRGKRIDNKVWVEGYYIYLSECDLHIIVGLDGQYNRIEPETRGECAGLTGKNDVKIFEGDIIRYTTKERSSIYGVCWNAEAACFAVYGSGLGEKTPIGDFTFFDPQKCEVLGNVHDTPELLK